MTEVQNTIVRWEALDVYFCGFSHIDCPFGFLLRPLLYLYFIDKKQKRDSKRVRLAPHDPTPRILFQPCTPVSILED